MKSRNSALAGIMLLGAVALWVDRLAFNPTPGRFDQQAFEEQVRRIWPIPLVSRPFAKSPLIPETHSHLRCEDPQQNLFAVYAGHYARLGRFELGPHDPQTCYTSLGFRILTRPQVHNIGTSAIQQMEIESYDEANRRTRLTVLYWVQYAGKMPAASVGLPSAQQQTQARYQQRRADLVWVRVELRGTGHQLKGALQTRLRALMQTTRKAMVCD